MEPITMVTLATQVIPTLFKAGLGIKQFLSSQDVGEQPKMEMPESVQRMLDMAEMGAQRQQMPGSDIAREQLSADTATATGNILDAAGGTAASLGAISDIYSKKSGQERALTAQDAAYQSQMEQNLVNALKYVGGVEQQMFNINELQPWMMAMQENAALKQGSARNIYNALGDLAKTVGGAYNTGLLQQIFQGNKNGSNLSQFGKLLGDMNNSGSAPRAMNNMFSVGTDALGGNGIEQPLSMSLPQTMTGPQEGQSFGGPTQGPLQQSYWGNALQNLMPLIQAGDTQQGASYPSPLYNPAQKSYYGDKLDFDYMNYILD